MDDGIQEWFTFTKGYDYISLKIRPINLEDDKVRFVSIGDEESYDITRYSIPLAKTMPEGLRNTVRSPIFNSDGEKFCCGKVPRGIVGECW
ncbi:hypothetical protein J2TS4_57030 [Paenibacillus sp. J2TS4]|nr:hypothetical protein J2TS4_57030 [Paenibacillus sp. J2TS4]